MFTWLLISLHHILHKDRIIMPHTEETIYNTVHNTQTSKSCTPQHCTFKCNKKKLCKHNQNQNISNKILRFWTGLLQTTEHSDTTPDSLHEYLISLKCLTFLQHCHCTKFLCWKYITWKPRMSPWEFPSLGKPVRLLRVVVMYLFFTHKSYAL